LSHTRRFIKMVPNLHTIPVIVKHVALTELRRTNPVYERAIPHMHERATRIDALRDIYSCINPVSFIASTSGATRMEAMEFVYQTRPQFVI